MSLKIDMSNGVSQDAKHFLDGFKKAYKQGMAVEYIEMFLDQFAHNQDAKEAAEVACDEWGIE